ncbi:uncharacterized protein [Montipora foliosa]|uniref:uncharacterized protein n=1 Tax=Montipora foliosa TaxID=591990 RepID=UPI0035F2066B
MDAGALTPHSPVLPTSRVSLPSITESESNSDENPDWKRRPEDAFQLLAYMFKYPEQAESLETTFNRLQTLKYLVDNNLNHPEEDMYNKVEEQILGLLFESSFNIRKPEGTPEAKQLAILVKFIVDIGGVEDLKRVAEYCFNRYELKEESDNEDDNSSDEDAPGSTCFDCLSDVLVVMLNFSDKHQGFCLACANAGVISMCLKNIKRIDAENIKRMDAENSCDNWQEENEDSEPEIKIIETSLGILHNISRRLRKRELFANSEQTLLYFAKKKIKAIAAPSLLTLAYLVDEDTNHLILAEENLLGFIVTLLDEACQSEDRHSNGYSAKELSEGLNRLAINDTNKKVLGKKGVTSILISVIKTSSEDDEKASATNALWTLAFNDKNKEAILQEDGAMELLRKLQQSTDTHLQKAAAGALWELEGKTARHAQRIELTRNHVMISYQWDSQEVLVDVKNRLQANGYRVWMDLEQMRGSTLDSMAKAVEDASVVLICASQKYKDSSNCRSEADYVYELKKDIIPLMMQRNYKADGWLGFLLGTKLRFPFYSKNAVASGVKKLIKELGERGKEVDDTDGPSDSVVQPVEGNVVGAAPPDRGVSTWTNEEVKQWFKEIGLEKVCQGDISEMTGQTLIDLQELRGECPDYFYKCVERSLKLTDMLDLLKFRRELSKLLRK